MSKIKVGEIEEICAVWAITREALLIEVDHIISLQEPGFLSQHPERFYLTVVLDGKQTGCVGGKVEYKTKADVPEHSVPCPCGNPKHWLIKYGEESNV